MRVIILRFSYIQKKLKLLEKDIGSDGFSSKFARIRFGFGLFLSNSESDYFLSNSNRTILPRIRSDLHRIQTILPFLEHMFIGAYENLPAHKCVADFSKDVCTSIRFWLFLINKRSYFGTFHNDLFTWQNKSIRKLCGEFQCPCCYQEEETKEYLLCNCAFTQPF